MFINSYIISKETKRKHRYRSPLFPFDRYSLSFIPRPWSLYETYAGPYGLSSARKRDEGTTSSFLGVYQRWFSEIRSASRDLRPISLLINIRFFFFYAYEDAHVRPFLLFFSLKSKSDRKLCDHWPYHPSSTSNFFQFH